MEVSQPGTRAKIRRWTNTVGCGPWIRSSLIYLDLYSQQVATGGLTGDQQVNFSPAFTCISPALALGEFFQAPQVRVVPISHLCITRLRVIGVRLSVNSLYVRIVAHTGLECVVPYETDWDFAQALASQQGLCKVGMKDSSIVSSNGPDWGIFICPDLYCAGGTLALQQERAGGGCACYLPAFTLRFSSSSYEKHFFCLRFIL